MKPTVLEQAKSLIAQVELAFIEGLHHVTALNELCLAACGQPYADNRQATEYMEQWSTNITPLEWYLEFGYTEEGKNPESKEALAALDEYLDHLSLWPGSPCEHSEIEETHQEAFLRSLAQLEKFIESSGTKGAWNNSMRNHIMSLRGIMASFGTIGRDANALREPLYHYITEKYPE